jgi:hypothetical protein
VACYVHAIGDDALAARLLGAAERLRGAVDQSDVDRRNLDQLLRTSLGDREYEGCYASGCTATREENQALLAHVLDQQDGQASETLRR